MSGHRYVKSTNPFDEDDEIDDETFLRNSRRTNGLQRPSYEEQIQTFQERRQVIEDRTLQSTERSISILRDSEQIGIATAEELLRQREKLEKTDKQLDEINSTLRFSQKHINGIKSVFSSLKNYMSGRNDMPSPSSGSTNSNPEPSRSGLESDLNEKVKNYDRYENHPTTRLRNTEYDNNVQMQQRQPSASKDFSARLDANLQEMCSNIQLLKGLASNLSTEIDTQNELLDNITDKAEVAGMTVAKQNKDMNKILRKN